MNGTSRIFVGAAVTALISNCTVGDRAAREIDKDGVAAERYTDTAKQPFGPDPSARSSFVLHDGVYLGHKAIQKAPGSALPAEWSGPRSITIHETEPLSPSELAAIISQQTGVKVISEDDSPSSPGGGDAAPPLRFGAPPGAGPLATNRDRGECTLIPNYVGPLGGLLDTIATRCNLTWSYDSGIIRFSRFETRTFTFYPLAAESQVVAGLDNGGNSSNTQQAGNGETPRLGTTQIQSVAAIKIWAQIKDGVDTILGGKGRASYTSSIGTITVIAPASEMRQVRDYLRIQNEKTLRQVTISTAVLSIQLSDQDQYNFDLTTFIKDAIGNQPFVITPNGAGKVALGIIHSLNGAAPQTQTQAILQALSTRANTRVLLSPTVTTLNNQPAPLQVATQQGYLASVSQTSTVNVGSTASLVPGIVTSGFTMNLLPRILGDGRVLLQYNIAITDLQNLRTVSSGAQSIEVPEIASRTFIDQNLLRSGDTAIVTGFSQANDNDARTGVGHPDNFLLGGSRNGSQTRTMIAILLTPEIAPASPMSEAVIR